MQNNHNLFTLLISSLIVAFVTSGLLYVLGFIIFSWPLVANFIYVFKVSFWVALGFFNLIYMFAGFTYMNKNDHYKSLINRNK